MPDRPEDDIPDLDSPSKSQRKREAQALTALGRRVAELPAGDYATLPLNGMLREALDEVRGMRSHGARKRQQQYIGKLLRHGDDAERLEAALAAIENRGREDAARQHRIERWRERLLAEGDSALSELLTEYPQADRNHLRRLLRTARREADAEKPPRAARELFRALRQLAEGD